MTCTCILTFLLLVYFICGEANNANAANPLYAKRPMDCDETTGIAAGETLFIHAFPPKEYSAHSLAYGPWRVSPRECTWTFTAIGNCTLEFITAAYERGDVDCSHQFLLFGDEHSEQRVCGFEKPPALMVSTGSSLFLTHFQRNRGYETKSSVWTGTLHCRQLLNSAPCTCKQVQLQRDFLTRHCLNPGDCPVKGNVTVGDQIQTLEMNCIASASSQCLLEIRTFSAVVSLQKSCVAPVPAIPPRRGNCSTIE